jgi:hypothetical protein
MKHFFDSIQEINAFISNQKIFNNVPWKESSEK